MYVCLRCDGTGTDGMHSGVVVFDTGVFKSKNDHFRDAIRIPADFSMPSAFGNFTEFCNYNLASFDTRLASIIHLFRTRYGNRGARHSGVEGCDHRSLGAHRRRAAHDQPVQLFFLN